MSGGLDVTAVVVAYRKLGFIDHEGGSFSQYDQVLIRIDEPADRRGTEVNLVLDEPLAGGTILENPGQRVGLTLDENVLDLDVVFSGGIVGGRVTAVTAGGGP